MNIFRKTIRRTIVLAVLIATGAFSSLPAFAKTLVLVGGGFKDMATVVYQSNGTTPKTPNPNDTSGDPNTNAIYKKIIALAGGSKNIGIITTASDPAGDAASPQTGPAGNGKYYTDVFKYFGAGANTQYLPIVVNSTGTSCATNTSDPALVSKINSMDGFFVGGGDQSRILKCFFSGTSSRTDTPIMTALRNRYNAGAVVSGTSAGTAIQAAIPMITGGESYYALKSGSYTTISGDNLAYDPLGGYGFFNYGTLDTHFSERGRQGRIVRLAWDQVKSMAYGVDENTALVVTNVDTTSANMEVLGQGGVFIFDLSAASTTRVRPTSTSSCSSASGFKLCNVITNYLTQGDTFNPTTKVFTKASYKSTIAAPTSGNLVGSNRDIFSSPDASTAGRVYPREFVNLAIRMFTSKYLGAEEITYEGTSGSSSSPQFKACLANTTASGTQGYTGSTTLINGASATYTSFVKVILDLTPSSTPCY